MIYFIYKNILNYIYM